eukprot:40229-Pleurochrysis_carterae.AAC.1
MTAMRATASAAAAGAGAFRQPRAGSGAATRVSAQHSGAERLKPRDPRTGRGRSGRESRSSRRSQPGTRATPTRRPSETETREVGGSLTVGRKQEARA